MSVLELKDLAKALDGMEYGERVDPDIIEVAKAGGLVILMGASDDLAEFYGAIDDEFGCYDGGTIYINRLGVFENKCLSGCPYAEIEQAKCQTIEAIWCPDDPKCSWIYKTDIPHETFNVYDDGELYCVGIVFRVCDLRPLDGGGTV